MRLAYQIAGRADDELFAKTLRTAEVLAASLPSFTFDKYLIHPDDWNAFLKETCDKYRFKHEGSPLVWSSTGTYIGGAAEFSQVVKKFYNFSVDIPAPVLSEMARENLQECVTRREETKEQETLANQQKQLQEKKNKLYIKLKTLLYIRQELLSARICLSKLRTLNGPVSKLGNILSKKPLNAKKGLIAWKYQLEGYWNWFQENMKDLFDVVPTIESHLECLAKEWTMEILFFYHEAFGESHGDSQVAAKAKRVLQLFTHVDSIFLDPQAEPDALKWDADKVTAAAKELVDCCISLLESLKSIKRTRSKQYKILSARVDTDIKEADFDVHEILSFAKDDLEKQFFEDILDD